MTDCTEQVKRVAAETEGTPAVKLVAVLMAQGITSTAELSSIVGIGERAIWRIKAGLRTMVYRPGGWSVDHGPETSPLVSGPAPIARADNTTRATKDFPTERVFEDKKEVSLVVLSENEPPADCLSSPPAPTRCENKSRGSRLPDDWQLPDDWRQWAEVNFPAWPRERVATEADTFRDYWHATAGAKARKVNWQATWRNWCRTSAQRMRGGAPMNWGRNASDEASQTPFAKAVARRLAAQGVPN